MYKVRVKKKTNPGDQVDYGLVTGNIYEHKNVGDGFNKATNPEVTNTMGAVPREEANVEVEGGETVVGDMNGDGFLEHFTFKGKKHSQGGIPANIPEGSFIFSNTPKLRIKDPEILAHFGKKAAKKGITPAQIAKQYDINQYVYTLRDEDADPIAKDTAQLMLDTNLKKLAELSMVQEQMKGMPDGVPALAESVMPEAKFGGSFQEGGNTRVGQREADGHAKTNIIINPDGTTTQSSNAKSLSSLRRGQTYTINGQQVTIEPYKGFTGTDWVKFDKPLKVKNSRGKTITIDELPAEDLLQAQDRDIFLGEDRGWFNRGYRNIENLNESDYGLLPLFGSAAADLNQAFNYSEEAIPIRVGAQPQNYTKDLGKKFIKNNIEYRLEEPIANDYSGKRVVKLKEIRDNNKNIGSYFSSTGDDLVVSYESLMSDFEPLDDNLYNPQPSSSKQRYPQAKRLSYEEMKAWEEYANPKSKPQTQTQSRSTRTQAAPQQTKLKPTGIKFKYGGTVKKYQEAGEVQAKEPTIEIMVDENTGEFVVVDIKSGREVLRTYQGSGATPTGIQDKYQQTQTPEEFGKWYMGWVNSFGIQPNEIKDNSDFQSRFYNKLLETNPDAIAAMWTNAGLHKQGLANTDLVKRLQQTGAYKNGKFDFTKLDPQNRDAVLKDLGTVFPDNKVGVRMLDQYAIEDKPVQEEVPRVVDPEDPGEPEKEWSGNTAVFESEAEPLQRGWWVQDIANLMAASTDRINEYRPSRQQVNMEVPDYALLDPSRQVAAVQEQQGRFQDMASLTAPGTVARANVLGSSGEAAGQIADVLANYENQNVGIYNQASANASQIRNQEQLTNVGFDRQYQADMATLSQNTDNALRDKKYRQLNAFVRGSENEKKRLMFEGVLNPNVRIDPITGVPRVVGSDKNNRDTIDAGTYLYPGGAMGAGVDYRSMAFNNATSMLEEQRKLLNQGYTESEARWALQNAARETRPNFRTSDINYRNQNMIDMFDHLNFK